MKVTIGLKKMWSGNRTRGVGAYTHNLIRALSKEYPDSTFTPNSSDYFGSGADLVHFPFFDPFFLTLPLRKSIPTVVTIHDLIPLKYPSHFPRGLRGSFKWRVQQFSAKKCRHIITDSSASKRDIVKYLGVSEDFVTVIPLAPASKKLSKASVQSAKSKYSLPDKYLLYVGDINWNKNIPGLISTFNKLSDSNLHLVLVGKSLSGNSRIKEARAIDQAIRKSPQASNIHRLGFVESSDLPAIYAAATLYVQPSFDEGFGLPLLEAMQAGCPVACSRRGSLPEVGGDAVAYFDPDRNMAQIISDLLKSKSARDKLIKLGSQRVKKFSWDQVAKDTYAVYEKALN